MWTGPGREQRGDAGRESGYFKRGREGALSGTAFPRRGGWAETRIVTSQPHEELGKGILGRGTSRCKGPAIGTAWRAEGQQVATVTHQESGRSWASAFASVPHSPVLGRELSGQKRGSGHGFLKGASGLEGAREGGREGRPRCCKRARLQGCYRVCCCSLAAT